MNVPQCEILAIDNLARQYCSSNDALLFYGSFPILGHEGTRDIDVLAISTISNEVRRLRSPSQCVAQQPINLYVIPLQVVNEDLKTFKYGGWWVTKTLLGYSPARNEDVGFQFMINSLISYVHRTNIILDDDLDSAMAQIACSLCIRYPTFIKSIAKMFRVSTWQQVFRDQIRVARSNSGSIDLTHLTPMHDNLYDDRRRHYWEMLRLRPLEVSNDIAPATVKMRQAREGFLNELSLFERLFGIDNVNNILVAIDEVISILQDLELAHRNGKIHL